MGPKYSRRTLLNIALTATIILLIVAAIYVYLINPEGNNERVLRVEDIIDSPIEHLGKEITVHGYYYPGSNPEGWGDITSTAVDPLSSSWEFVQRLSLNHTAVNMTLIEDRKYSFTGVLVEDESAPGQAVILVVNEIKEV